MVGSTAIGCLSAPSCRLLARPGGKFFTCFCDMSCVRSSVELCVNQKGVRHSGSRASLAFLPSSARLVLSHQPLIQRLIACQPSTTPTDYQNEEKPPCQYQYLPVMIPTERIHQNLAFPYLKLMNSAIGHIASSSTHDENVAIPTEMMRKVTSVSRLSTPTAFKCFFTINIK